MQDIADSLKEAGAAMKGGGNRYTSTIHDILKVQAVAA